MVRYTEGEVLDALNRVQRMTADNGNPYLRDIKQGEPAVMVTCPFHGEHSEHSPSCGVFIQRHDGFHIGDFHCFACKSSGNFAQFIGGCLGISESDAEGWLLATCGGERLEEELKPIGVEEEPQEYPDESCLKQYDFYHPYMWERKLTKEVVDKFRVGYDKATNSLVFPVWDEYGRFRFVTSRSVRTKKFNIPPMAEKPVYLLNYVIKEGITDHVYVCESQINTLTCYCYGRTAVGLFGTGSKGQLEILNRSGVDHFILALDPDDAGEAGTLRLIRNLRDDKLVDVMLVPRGKDINDLSREEFDACEVISSIEWMSRHQDLIRKRK